MVVPSDVSLCFNMHCLALVHATGSVC